MGWTHTIDFSRALQQRAKEQMAKGMAENETVLPAWMLEDLPCAAPSSNEQARATLLESAAVDLGAGDWGKERHVEKLSGGQELHLWEHLSPCEGHEIQGFRARFEIPAAPAEVFTALASRRSGWQWNPSVDRVEVGNFSKGARGVHETWVPPKPEPLEHREVWEWQAASFNETTGVYTLALGSNTNPSSAPFSG